MVAGRPMRYGTRRLRAGDMFSATHGEATIFRALRWASDAADRVQVGREDYVLRAAAMQAEDDIDVLRTEYELRAGKTADKRWGVARLKSEIEALQ
jgi:hypothetical protein